MKLSSQVYKSCVYCQFYVPVNMLLPFPACGECASILSGHGNCVLTEKLKLLIRAYRVKYRLYDTAKGELIKRGLGAAGQLLRASEMARGERKIRGLLSAYKYRAMIEELSNPSPEDQLILTKRRKNAPK